MVGLTRHPQREAARSLAGFLCTLLVAGCVSDPKMMTGKPPPPRRVRVVEDVGQVGPPPSGFVAIGDRAFYSADEGGSDGVGIFVYFYNTTLAKWDTDRIPGWGGPGAVANELIGHSDWLYFVDDSVRIWKTDGVSLKSIKTVGGETTFPHVYDLVESTSSLYAISESDGEITVWRIDHATETAEIVATLEDSGGVPVADSAADCDFDAGGMLAFAIDTDDGPRVCTLTEGTEGYSFTILGTDFGTLDDFTGVGSDLYFSASEASEEPHLWFFNGTSAWEVTDGYGNKYYAPKYFVDSKPYLFCAADRVFPLSGQRALRAEGGAAVDVSGFTDTDIHGVARCSGSTWFLATDATWASIWKIDSAGVATGMPVPGSTDAYHFVCLGSNLVYCSTVGSEDEEDYLLIEFLTSEFTETPTYEPPPAGTSLTATFDGLASPTTLSQVHPCGERILLSAEHTTTGYQPWHYVEF